MIDGLDPMGDNFDPMSNDSNLMSDSLDSMSNNSNSMTDTSSQLSGRLTRTDLVTEPAPFSLLSSDNDPASVHRSPPISVSLGPGHAERTRLFLKRRQAFPQEVKGFIDDLVRLNLQWRSNDRSRWQQAFPKAFTLERELQDVFDERLRSLPGGDRVSRGKPLQNGSIMDCLIEDCETGLPRALVEYKRPVCSGNRRVLRVLDVLAHIDRVINYGTQLMLLYPQLAFLPLILTNGWSFIAGYGKRDSLGDLGFHVCKAPFSLYDWESETMGINFGLFWMLCNYKSKQPLSLDVEISAFPRIIVKIEKCIGHGASSFVYQASLVRDPALETSTNSTYVGLKAHEAVAVKIPKANERGTLDAVSSEMRAIRQFVSAGIQNCCVFPISWENGMNILVYPMGVPVAPTVSTKLIGKSPLKLKHFAGLLEDLCAMHAANIVHRDVRLPSILIMGKKAKLTDFGFSAPPGSSLYMRGTLETASQAVLTAVIRRRTIYYIPRDDLESLLKVYIMHHNGFKIRPLEKKSWIKVVYRAWKPNIRMCGIEGMDYNQLVDYLKKLFNCRERAWEKHTRAECSVAVQMGFQ